LRKSIAAIAAAAVVAVGLSVGASASATIPTGNLVANPSFETNTSGWYGDQAYLTRVSDSAAPDGSYVAKVQAGTNSYYGVGDTSAAVQSAPANQSYTVSAMVKAFSSVTTGDWVTLGVREIGPQGVVREVTNTAASTNAWASRSITVTPATGNALAVFASQSSNVTSLDAFLIDAVTVVANGTSTPPTTEPTTPPTTQPTTPPTTQPTTPPTTQPTTPPTTQPTTPPTTQPTTPPATGTVYPLHTNIVATTFWVGELFNANLSDGSQLCSTYDSDWAYHHTGRNLGTTPSNDPGCGGAIFGGCDGVSTGTTASTFKCRTEARTAANGYFPTQQPTPLENPFYVDLPYDDLNDSTGFSQRCTVIPWAAADNARTGVNNCTNEDYSYMKNRWVKITGPNGATVYAQNEDAGPSSGSLYHDKNYVFGSNDARPANKKFGPTSAEGAGIDVSPAVNGALGFAELDGNSDKVSWRFVDAVDVPAGPWKTVVTTSQVHN